jgi:hypothetical protein
VVEEKLDGANSAVSFDEAGEMLLQSRGHFLVGGPRERHFDLLKAWAGRHSGRLRAVLGVRYVLYGEWLYAKHTLFYDALPHYFLEFDVLDKEAGGFLSTDRRRDLLGGLPLVSAPVVWRGRTDAPERLPGLVGRSRFRTAAGRQTLIRLASDLGISSTEVLRETDPSDLMEGLYVKVEEGGWVVERYKYIRASFLAAVLDSGSHWLSRPILPNQLCDRADLWRADR